MKGCGHFCYYTVLFLLYVFQRPDYLFQYTFPEFHNLVLKGHEKEAGIDKNVNIVLRLCGNTYSFSRRQTVDCLNRKYSESFFFWLNKEH